MTRHALAINGGSSSLKYALFAIDGGDARALLRGAVTGIGDAVPDHFAAITRVVAELARDRAPEPDVVGHRLVHGGPQHFEPAIIDDALLASLREALPFAPLHLPSEIAAIEATRARWPAVPEVACFDTAFHTAMPDVARRYALPRALHDAGVRRYGFHGLSYEFVVGALGPSLGARAVIAHLGNGASMVAVRDGRAIDTTMGMTPAGGLVMGTRPGDLDPGVILHLLDRGWDARAIERLVNHESGLLALSETTSDVRSLLGARTVDARAAFALEAFAYDARKWVGALAATLGGIDTLVFTGGVGEHAPLVRAEIVNGLGHLGMTLDEAANARHADVISAKGSACTVRVVATDEERVVARHAARILARA